jgi:glutathione synthase/RimK-type ligase-like ATP-grasp enzyme
MGRIILLLGRKDDPHISGIVQELDCSSRDFVLLEELSVNDHLIVKFDDGLVEGSIHKGSKEYPLKEIKSVWNSSPLRIHVSGVTKEALDFVRSEWNEGILSLWNALQTRWINHPYAIYNSSNRLKQLQMAHRFGFLTPKTVVTNNPDTFVSFFGESEGNVIAKTLSSSIGLPKNKMILSTKMTRKDVDFAKALIYAPCMFQEYISKKTELRVTVIGKILHTAEIHSQRSERTMHDWRNYDDFQKTPYQETALPDEISDKLLRLMEAMKLEFGTIDLIRTPNDDIYFLEINPNGRWWWIQGLTGMSIAKDIATYLSKDF